MAHTSALGTAAADAAKWVKRRGNCSTQPRATISMGMSAGLCGPRSVTEAAERRRWPLPHWKAKVRRVGQAGLRSCYPDPSTETSGVGGPPSRISSEGPHERASRRKSDQYPPAHSKSRVMVSTQLAHVLSTFLLVDGIRVLKKQFFSWASRCAAHRPHWVRWLTRSSGPQHRYNHPLIDILSAKWIQK
jgi:hypothetical protein